MVIDEPATGDDASIIVFPATYDNSNPSKFRQQITEQTGQETVVQKILK